MEASISELFLLTTAYHAHKVRWDDWSRADGTKTTWEDGSTLSAAPWNTIQRHLRQEKAAMSFEIEILYTTDIHNTLTHLREQGGKEKAKRLRTEPQPDFLEEMDRNLARHQTDLGNLSTSYALRIQRQSTRPKTGNSLVSTSERSRLSMQSYTPSVGSSASFGSTTASSSHSGRFSPMDKSVFSSSARESPAMRSPMEPKRTESPDSNTAFRSSIHPSHMSPPESQNQPASVIETPAIALVVLFSAFSVLKRLTV